MITIIDKHNCCGCEACVQACPKHCISFTEDEEGFRYPQVEVSDCIHCNLCEKVCPVVNQEDVVKPLFVYAAKNKNEEELLQSSSGGIFVLLAKSIIQQGGVVFGARFDDNWDVIHDYAETMKDVKVFMGAKYVQSRIGETYIQARTFLESGRKVLYSGTPCQIAGLKHFLRKDYDNLLTVDVICHGVPSPKVWRRYIKEIKENTSGTSSDVRIESISFRDKRTGWKKYNFALTLTKASADGKKITVLLSHIYNEDPYMRLFLRNLILRPSCYQCPAKSGKSQSDLTIADFWGIEKSHPDFDDNRGVGLLMVNSEKGHNYLGELSILLKEISLADATNMNPSYMYSVGEPSTREQCFRLLNASEKRMDVLTERLLRPSLCTKLKKLIKRMIRK